MAALSGGSRVVPGWLALREDSDAAARAPDLVEVLRAHLPRSAELVVRDLGSGTGAMGRWLAGSLPAPQRWILHDTDPELLHHAEANPPAGVAVRTRRSDVTALGSADLGGTSLVTASALVDLLTGGEVERLAAACVGAGCPALLTLSVTGRVELDPVDPLDAELGAAFNAHQRRSARGSRLLGPDAPEVMATAFGRRGARVHRRTSPWRLGPGEAALAEQWLRGWVEAACEQRPELADYAHSYLRGRLQACADGALRVVVHHEDLLTLPA